MAPQSWTLIVAGAQPLQAPDSPDGIPAMLESAAGIAIGMTRICTPSESARTRTRLNARRDTESTTRLL